MPQCGVPWPRARIAIGRQSLRPRLVGLGAAGRAPAAARCRRAAPAGAGGDRQGSRSGGQQLLRLDGLWHWRSGMLRGHSDMVVVQNSCQEATTDAAAVAAPVHLWLHLLRGRNQQRNVNQVCSLMMLRPRVHTCFIFRTVYCEVPSPLQDSRLLRCVNIELTCFQRASTALC